MQALIAPAPANLVDELKISLGQRFPVDVQVTFEGFFALGQLSVLLVRRFPRAKAANLRLDALYLLFNFVVLEVP